MTLEEHDLEIVRAAEALYDLWEKPSGMASVGHSATLELQRSVKAKREAMRPKCAVFIGDACDSARCGKLAVQRFEDAADGGYAYRCAEHKVTVTEI